MTAHLRVPSPIGDWVVEGSETGIHRLTLETTPSIDGANSASASPLLERAAEELREYFAGARRHWTVPLSPLDGTDFQRHVWRELQNIPFGQTVTYGELASRLNRPRAARAVGGANGANPLPIFVPCHRVVGAHSLGGYSMGGARVKEFLLLLEGSWA